MEQTSFIGLVGLNRVGYLQALCNKYGDIKVAKAWKDANTGELVWTKHRSVLSCWESEEGLKFLETVNNRTGIDCEIRIDLDPKKISKKDCMGTVMLVDQTKQELDDWFNQVCDKLEELGLKRYAGFHSGSRSYHISVIEPELVARSAQNRKELKAYIIEKVGGDLIKVSDNTMMTLENCPNNKTGRIKEFVRGDSNWTRLDA